MLLLSPKIIDQLQFRIGTVYENKIYRHKRSIRTFHDGSLNRLLKIKKEAPLNDASFID
ncbi:hypothetical protein [Mucilaginibacter sp.]|uniref:hypothetical protein n=1 Tax=Mucilaginibacter sp. TaxID=1882438 RepID=UPI003AFFF29E